MSEEFMGSCLCGDVAFKISGRFESFFLCHCTRCQKGSGSAHGANLFSKSAKIIWTKGEDNIKTYRIPETRYERCFCKECGTTLPTLQMNGALLVVPAGSLDSPIAIQPNAHIFYASRAAWDNNLNCIEKCDGLPS